MFDVTTFKKLYPAFDGIDNDVIELVAEQALCYLGRCDKCKEQAWFLVVAHLLALRESGAGSAVQSASRGSESVSFALGNTARGGAWWQASPYGSQYLALVSRCHTVRYVAGVRPLRR